MGGIEANNSNSFNSVVESNQIDKKEAKEIALLTEEPGPVLNSQDAVKTENSVKEEQAPLVPVSENKTNESDGNGFCSGLVCWGYYLFSKKEKR